MMPLKITVYWWPYVKLLNVSMMKMPHMQYIYFIINNSKETSLLVYVMEAYRTQKHVSVKDFEKREGERKHQVISSLLVKAGIAMQQSRALFLHIPLLRSILTYPLA